MITEILYNNKADTRIDTFLKAQFPEYSRTKIQKLIVNSSFKVDSYVVKPSYKLKGTKVITYDDSYENENAEQSKVVAQNISLDIIYEDEALLVVNKPSGLIVHPGAGNPDGTLLNGLMYHYENNLSEIDNSRPGIIHRLDKETSVVILIAKTNQMHYNISKQFADRKIKKIYKAIVWGCPIQDKSKIEGYLSRNKKNRLAFELSQRKGKYSSTIFKVVNKYTLPFSLLEVFPITGRTHQIRVHLSSIGLPIINDDLYSGGSKRLKSYNSNIRLEMKKALSKINRVALHAESISFYHPIKEKKLTFNAKLPKDFLNFIDICGENE